MADRGQIEHERGLAAFDQNSQTFRSLNQLMWQIPIIAMTLTGGLWFGVSKTGSSPIFQFCLLFLAFAGNIGLIFVLGRLRYIMGEYLVWLEKFYPDGFVAAKGSGFGTDSYTVRWVFQVLLGLAAIISGVLMALTAAKIECGESRPSASLQSVAFYNQYADRLAAAYESVAFESAHPYLAMTLSSGPMKRILDIGSGSGRDAAWMALAGHSVTAVEPSEKMLRRARALHGDGAIRWLDSGLPALDELGPTQSSFDVIVLSAVWMHIHPADQRQALARLSALLAPDGFIYMTLRLGPAEPERSLRTVSMDEVNTIAKPLGLRMQDLGERKDLLSRKNVRWRTLTLSREAKGASSSPDWG